MYYIIVLRPGARLPEFAWVDSADLESTMDRLEEMVEDPEYAGCWLELVTRSVRRFCKEE